MSNHSLETTSDGDKLTSPYTSGEKYTKNHATAQETHTKKTV